MPNPVVQSQIQNTTQRLSDLNLERIQTLIDTVNTNLQTQNLTVPNIALSNVSGNVSNLDMNLTQSLNDDLLSTINEATGAISGVSNAFNNVVSNFSSELSGLAGGIGSLNNLTSSLGDLTGAFDDLLNITDNLNIPGLDKLGELTGTLDSFLADAQGLLNELSNIESSVTNILNGGIAEELTNRVDRTAANPDFYLDNFNTITIRSREIGQSLISNGQLNSGTVVKIENTREYFVVENGSLLQLWDYNVNRVRNGQSAFKPRGAVTVRVVQGVPIYRSSE